MFGELPKVFGKEFLIGYFLPAAVLILAASGLLELSGYLTTFGLLRKAFIEADEKKLAIHLSLAVAAIWAFGTLLLAINYKLIRILEGYGKANPARLLKPWSLHVFDRTTKRLTELDDKKPLSRDLINERRRLRVKLANEFPESRDLVLPTRFGNVVRAFERYPQIIYNIEAIRAWTRLQAVLPEYYRGSLDASKAILDFYVNLWFGATLVTLASAIAIISFLVLGLHRESLSITLAAGIVGIICAVLTANSARAAASQWGELVKGAFDLYRGDLCRQLGFELPRSIELEREMWAPICRTMIYRQSRYAEKFAGFRPLPKREE